MREEEAGGRTGSAEEWMVLAESLLATGTSAHSGALLVVGFAEKLLQMQQSLLELFVVGASVKRSAGSWRKWRSCWNGSEDTLCR